MLRSAEFIRVLRDPDGKRSSGPISARVKLNGLNGARLGVVVGKKGNASAVRRNRIKRIIRERFRQQRNTLPNVDVVVQVFAAVDDKRLSQWLSNQFNMLAESKPNDHTDYAK